MFKQLLAFVLMIGIAAGQVGTSPGVTGGVSSSGSSVLSGVISPLTFGAKFDVQTVPDAAVTSGSNIITCPNSDCHFLTTAKVGHIVFATLGNGSSCQDNATSLPQTTIQSIDSDTQIHTVGNASAGTGTAIHCLAWGTDDTTAINAAWASGGCTTNFQMPQGKTFISAPIWQTVAGCLPVTSAGNGYQGPIVHGASVTGTYVIPVPNFSFGTCGSGTNGACIGNPNISDYENFNVWGLGVQCATTHTANLFLIGLATRFINVNLVGWCARGGGTALIGANVIGVTDIINYSGFNFFGTVSLQLSSTNIFFGNSATSSNTFAVTGICGVVYNTNSSVFSTSNFFQTCTTIGTGATLTSINSSYQANDAPGASISLGTNSTLNLLSNDLVANGGSGLNGVIGIFYGSTGATVRASYSTINGGVSGGISVNGVAGNTFYDVIANKFVAGSAGIWNGVVGTWLVDSGHSLKGSCTGTVTASTTLGLYGTGPNVTATTCASTIIGSGTVMSGIRTLNYLFVNAGTGGTNASSGVVTVLKNGSATGMTCTLGTTTFCQSSTAVTTADGDLISVSFTTQAADTLANVKVAVGWQ